MHGKRTKALGAIERLNISQVEAEKDILTVTDNQPLHDTGIGSFLVIFRHQYRARTVLALFILGMTQLSGIDGVLYVSVSSTQVPESLR